MNPNIFVCCLCLQLLLYCIYAKPLSDLQSLKQLLEEEINTAPFYSSMEMEVEGKDLSSPEEQRWEFSDPRNSALESKDDAFARLFKDLLRTSKRSWSRYKKGGLRSCFGVRLERIGSFSGLGC